MLRVLIWCKTRLDFMRCSKLALQVRSDRYLQCWSRALIIMFRFACAAKCRLHPCPADQEQPPAAQSRSDCADGGQCSQRRDSPRECRWHPPGLAAEAGRR